MDPNSNASLRPTVLIGLGGTGHDILLRIKKCFIQVFGEIPPFISFLSIDVAEPENPTLITPEGAHVSLDPLSERLVLQVANPANIIGDHNPHITEWWPENTLVSAITAGATQIRPRGRLALFAKYSEVRKRLKDTIDKVSSMRALAEMDDRDLKRSERVGIEVFIISSVAGGTGSGMFLDIAFNIRDLIDSASNSTGVLVLPRIFDGDPGIRQKPNSYAALKEVEFFMKIRQGDNYFIDYGGDKPVKISRAPFDLLFLIDGINERRSVISDKTDLFDMAAEGVFMQIGSQMGTRSVNTLDNIKGKMSASGLVCSRSATYCSFGIASLTIDDGHYRSAVNSSRLAAAETLVEEILGVPDRVDSASGAEISMADLQLPWGTEIDPLLNQLTKSEQGAPIRSSLRTTGLPEDRSRIDTELGGRYETLKSRVREEVGKALEVNSRAFESNFLVNLNDWIEKQLNFTPGLRSLTKQIEQIVDKTTRMEEWLQNELRNNEQDFKKAAARVLSTKEDIQRATGPLRYIMGGKERVRRLASRFEQEVNDEMDLLVQVEAKKTAASLIGRSRSSIEAALQQVVRVIQTWESVLQDVQKERKEAPTYKSEPKPFDTTLPIDSKFLAKLEHHINPADFLSFCSNELGSAGNVYKRSSPEILKLVFRFVDQRYGSVVASGIESVLEQMRPEDRAKVFKRLSDMAAPLWSFDESKLPLPNETLMDTWCYGVFDASSTTLKKMDGMLAPGRTASSFVSLFDPHRVTLFRVRAGVPLFILEEIDELEYSYHNKAQMRTSSHIDKRWEVFPNIIPFQYQAEAIRSATRTNLVFNLAMLPTLGIISRSEDGYHLRADRTNGKVIHLGKTRREAIDAVEKNSDYLQTMQNLVKSLVESQDETNLRSVLRQTALRLRDNSPRRSINFESIDSIDGEIVAFEEISSLPRLLDLWS